MEYIFLYFNALEITFNHINTTFKRKFQQIKIEIKHQIQGKLMKSN